MGNFRQGGRGGFDRRNSSGGSRFGGRDRDSRRSSEMFDATCNECGKRCQVPFRPTGSKPVYCNDCYKQKDGSNFRNNDNQSAIPSEQLNKINVKLDKIIQVLENLEIYADEEEYEEDDEDDEDEEESDDEDLEEEEYADDDEDEEDEDEEEEEDKASKPKSDIDY